MRSLLSRPSLEKGIFPAAALLIIVVFTPVIVRGAPLADDFHNCLAPIHLGLGDFLADSWDRLGMVRLARFPEILLTTGVCRRLPFAFAIAVPASLSVAVAFALVGLLRDQGLRSPWPELGGAVWLLQPLGTESALWPAALHVPLGLLLTLGALRFHRRGRHGTGVAATLGASFSVEQIILVFPVAVWFTCRGRERRRAMALTLGVMVGVIVLFTLWHGDDPRLQSGLAERLTAPAADPSFIFRFAGVGLGAHSIPLAAYWAFPASVLLFLGGATAGWVWGPRIAVSSPSRPAALRPTLLAAAVLIALANIPVLFSVQQQGSPRVFGPTWLILAAILPMVLGGRSWSSNRLLWAGGGLFVAGALLSLVLSVSVRVRSADFVEYATDRIARDVPEQADVALCGVRRTVVDPAPRGAFAIHEFVYDWAARDALRYYTGHRANFRLAGELWQHPCPGGDEVDRRFDFDRLIQDWSRR